MVRFMAEVRLEVGTLVTATVTWHEVFGMGIHLTEPPVDGVVDVIYVHEADHVAEDFPPIGAQVVGVVQGHMPNGQLRVSLRASDIDRYGHGANPP